MSHIPAPLTLLVRSISRPALVGAAAGAIAAVVLPAGQRVHTPR